MGVHNFPFDFGWFMGVHNFLGWFMGVHNFPLHNFPVESKER